jgi:hypothetical protein
MALIRHRPKVSQVVCDGQQQIDIVGFSRSAARYVSATAFCKPLGAIGCTHASESTTARSSAFKGTAV